MAPGGLALGDFNADGRADLAVSLSAPGVVSVVLGRGDGTFGPETRYPVGTLPGKVLIGDVDGDGRPDLVVLDSADAYYGVPGGISVLLGRGDGTFASEIRALDGDAPVAAVLGDWNGDGRLDLAVATYCASTANGCTPEEVSILIGDGHGRFNQASRFVVGNAPGGLAAADFNGDHRLDLAIQNAAPDPFDGSVNELTILPGNGDGTFGAGLTTGGIAGGSGAIVAGDFNGDGRPDVALTAFGSNAVSVFLARGDAGFTESSLNVGSHAADLALGDWNGDGRPDLATADYDADDVSVFSGDGHGRFGAALSTAAGNGPFALAFADLNGDGRPDLSVVNGETETVLIRFGNGDGTFGPGSRTLAGSRPVAVAAGDFNRDGRGDLVVTQFDDFPGAAQGGLSLLPGLGDGTFGPQVSLAAGEARGPVAVGDFDGDGAADLAVGNPPDGGVSIFLGRGDGTFAPETRQATGATPFRIVTDDLDGDGALDLVVVNWGSYSVSSPGDISILLGRGDGTFDPEIRMSAGPGPRSAAVGDFNGDGKKDLAVVSVTHLGYDPTPPAILIFTGNGDGTFAPATSLTPGPNPNDIVVADFNLDGDLDLAVANEGPLDTCIEPCAGDLSLFLGAGDGTFGPGARLTTGGAPTRVFAADIDGDGRGDLVTANGSFDLSVLRGAGDGTFGAPERFGTKGFPIGAAVADLDGDGMPDLVTVGDQAVTVLRNQAPGFSVHDLAIGFDNPIGKGSGSLTWKTTREIGLLGFDVYVAERTGSLMRLNPVLIACKECETGLDASYVYVVPKHKSGHNLFVQAITRRGPGPLVGPAARR